MAMTLRLTDAEARALPGCQVAGADKVAVSVLGFLAGNEHDLASGRDDDMGVRGAGWADRRG